MLARYMMSSSVCVCVCLSVTRHYFIKTAQHNNNNNNNNFRGAKYDRANGVIPNGAPNKVR